MNRFRFSCAILDAEFLPLLPKHDHVTLTNAIENPAILHNRSDNIIRVQVSGLYCRVRSVALILGVSFASCPRTKPCPLR